MHIVKDWSTARTYTREFRYYKREAINTAKDLGYSKEVIDDIQNAKSIHEISKIMRNARTDGESAVVNNFYDCSTTMGVCGARRRNHV